VSLGDDPAEAVRAVARDQLADAMRQLREEHEADPVAAVHAARKDLKKTRSLLRLARPALRRKAYRRLNDELRDIGRALAGTRDADVLAETVDKLAERYAGQVPKTTFTTLRRSFGAKARAARRAAAPAGHVEVIERVQAAHDAVAEWPVAGVDTEVLRQGAMRSYERGARALGAARKEPTAESLHEWRKRVKDHWYHLRLLREAWPEVLGAEADAAHRLADLMGDDHDLAALAVALGQRRAAAGAAVDEDEVLGLLTRRREELQAEAFALGARVYAEKPKAYGRRLGAWLALVRPPL
jgi:CHAD domain-containing protein